MSHPKTWRPMGSRKSSGTLPRSSMERYEMHSRASSRYGSTSAPVGHASRHFVHEPHRSAGGNSGAASDGESSSVVRITPRKIHEPSFAFRSSVFFPSQPSPAYLAKTRSLIGPVST